MKSSIPKLDDDRKRRWRQSLNSRRRAAIQAGHQADANIDKLIIRRFDRLLSVRRFIFLWIGLFVLLIIIGIIQIRGLTSYYQVLKPVPGGLYSEGLVGSFTNANPIYAAGTADSAVSHLVFSGLFKYNDKNVLVGDLAQSWSLEGSQTHYVVKLKKNIRWQDGKPFTADDVVFTYQMIQDPGAQSSLYTSWKGIKITRQNDYAVSFDLPNALSSFPYSLTTGILPQHLLKDIVPEQMRSAAFNTAPVGTGPFELKFINVTGATAAARQQRIALQSYKNYYAGRPKLDGFSLITFSDDSHLVSAFKQKQLNAITGLESLPMELANDDSVQTYSTPLTSEVMSFFNNSRPVLSDVNVRQALVASVDRKQLPSLFDNPIKLVNGPLLKSQLGYDPTVVESAYNPSAAAQILDQAGWTMGTDGIRHKANQSLSFTLKSQDSAQYTKVANFLQKQWAQIGVKVSVQYYDSQDLQSLVIANHDYDALLYGISLGVDPDIFAYWDSSQASISSQGHLNLSEYKSTAADQALEAGRTRSDPATRVTKYKTFLSTWVQDAPALALYQPNMLYITHGPVFHYQRTSDNSELDQFYNVNEWEVRQQKQNI